MGARRFPFPPLPLLVLGYLASRLPGLGRMPAFTDELLHLQWAEKVAGAGSWSSVVETLQWIFGPHGRWLQPVLAAPVVTWAADDLLAVRALMVAVGATGVVAAFRTAERCGGRGAAVITAILYTLCPFAVFHDRLALSDGLLCALTAWAVCLSMALAGAPGWNAGRTVGLALVLAAAIAAKLPGLLLLAFPPLALLLIGASWRRWLHGAVATGAALLSLLPFAGTLVRDSAQGP
jgi:4-amino-4-deoxy-L-arabinose transferase-like glycosyltransferase